MLSITLLQPFACILPLVFVPGLALLRFSQGVDRPRALADAFLCWTIASYAATEIFAQLQGLAFLPFFLLWAAIDGWLIYRLWPVRAKAMVFCSIPTSLPSAILGLILAATFFIACTAAPNNWDSLTYHLPRIEHWIQNGSLARYPTPDARQNDYGPLAEMLLLQLRILSGSDTLYPLIQWISMLCSVCAAFRIAQQLGGSDIQCWLASAFVASLPIGILESTSTQNDYVVAALLACFVTMGLEAISRPPASLPLVLAAAAAAALSGIVKPVGYISGVGFAVWFACALCRDSDVRTLARRAAGVSSVLILVMGPPAIRYLSADHSSSTRLALNGSFGLKQTFDNLVRNGMLNFIVGHPSIDTRSNRVVEAALSHLALDAHRADTSFGGFVTSSPPSGLYVLHEDFGPNPVHALLLILGLAALAIHGRTMPWSRRTSYCMAWLAGLVVMAALLRWAPWQTRYQLPLFVLGGPLLATSLPQRWLGARMATALNIILLLAALPPLLLNQSRPLLPLIPDRPFPVAWARPSYLAQSSTVRLFANNPALRQPYEDAETALLRSGATRIGLVQTTDSRWEYPIWRLLRDDGLDHPVRIEHLKAQDTTDYPLGAFVPDAVLWLGDGMAPDTMMLGDRQFTRVGPPRAVAALLPADVRWGRVWPHAVPEVLKRLAWQAEGIFDDGWLAQSGGLVVRTTKPGALVLAFMVPGGIGLDTQQLEIGGGPGLLIRKQAAAGSFQIEIPVDKDETALTFNFAHAAILPRGDGRQVGALLQSAHFRSR